MSTALDRLERDYWKCFIHQIRSGSKEEENKKVTNDNINNINNIEQVSHKFYQLTSYATPK